MEGLRSVKDDAASLVVMLSSTVADFDSVDANGHTEDRFFE
jgi:hypothetical protein